MTDKSAANRRDILKTGAAAAVLTAGGFGLGSARAASSGLAMSWDEWGKLDATGLARLLAAGQVTPKEVAAQAAKAVELIDPKINCVVEVFDDVVAEPLRDGMNQYGPFHGVPMLVKEAGSTMKGRLRESASAFLKGNRADKDSPLVRNFRRCPYHKLDPDVPMVESTEHGPHFDTSATLNGPSSRRILP